MNFRRPVSYTHLMCIRDRLYEVAELADQDDDIRVLIFHGAGRGFCAGDNITDGDLLKKRTFMGAYQYILGLQRVFNRIEAIKKPVIAAIHGAACLLYTSGQLRDLIELLIGLGVQGVQNVRLIECDDTESRFLFIDECFVHPFPLLSFIAEN